MIPLTYIHKQVPAYCQYNILPTPRGSYDALEREELPIVQTLTKKTN